MKYAIISQGVVTNFAEATEEFAAAQGWPAVEGEVAIGDTFDESGFHSAAASLETRKLALWQQVKACRSALTETPGAVASTPSGDVQVDALSKQNINGLVTMAMLAQMQAAPFSTDFTLADNSVVTINAAQMIGLGVAVGQYVEAAYVNARELRDAIEAAEDHEALDAIEIGAGWP